LLNAIGLTPCGSSTIHIYTQTIHRTTQLIWEECERSQTNQEEEGVFVRLPLYLFLQKCLADYRGRRERVWVPVKKNCWGLPSKDGEATSLNTKSERLNSTCTATLAWSERVNLCIRQVMILARKKKTNVSQSGLRPCFGEPCTSNLCPLPRHLSSALSLQLPRSVTLELSENKYC